MTSGDRFRGVDDSPDLRPLRHLVERIAELGEAGCERLELRFAAMRGDEASADRTIDAMESRMHAYLR